MAEQPQADILLLLSVALPPAALDMLGPLAEERTVNTVFGMVGPLGLRSGESGPSVWVEPYSGAPGRTDPRATILAAVQLGVQQVLVWDFCVALSPELQRGQVAIVVDYIDWTRSQHTTFADADTSVEQIANVAARPALCPRMTQALRETIPDAMEVVYVAVDGPRRETAAEARMYRMWGADVVGQNLSPEVALAQEAGLCFAGLVTVADLSADRASPEPHGEMRASLGTALNGLPALIKRFGQPGECTCASTVITLTALPTLASVSSKKCCEY